MVNGSPSNIAINVQSPTIIVDVVVVVVANLRLLVITVLVLHVYR